jgi:hypothetical protein
MYLKSALWRPITRCTIWPTVVQRLVFAQCTGDIPNLQSGSKLHNNLWSPLSLMEHVGKASQNRPRPLHIISYQVIHPFQQHDMKVHGELELWSQVLLMKVMRWVSGCMHRPPHFRRRREFSTYKMGSWVGQVDGLDPLHPLHLSEIEPWMRGHPVCTLVNVGTELQSSYHAHEMKIVALNKLRIRFTFS